METIPTQALAVLDDAAEALDTVLAAGLELHFQPPPSGRRLRAYVRDVDGQTLAEVGLREALALISA